MTLAAPRLATSLSPSLATKSMIQTMSASIISTGVGSRSGRGRIGRPGLPSLRSKRSRSCRVLMFRIEFESRGEKSFGPCSCCGRESKTVWGFVFSNESPLAVYYVQWTPGHIPMTAFFDLIFGDWSAGSQPKGRGLCSLEFQNVNGEPAFLAIDAAGRPAADGSVAGLVASREQFMKLPIKDQLFELADYVYYNDPRLQDLRG